jgi:pro-apoptotic serine protease NMA111
MFNPLLLLSPFVAAVALADGPPPEWATTLDRVVPGVVSIRTDAVRSFDMEGAGNMVATGFVVDAKRGILLSNRHVVGPGPTTAEAVFLDHEEVPLRPIYRDPVHDFGFYRFDPTDVRFMDVVELSLAPERARVGAEIRVIGNDAGEKISILAGTLARLDRAAPIYGVNRFNDFNTFYYQAASSTSGGSSGSPVVDLDGNVVALNAGGSRRAATSFYLPLDRVVRALDLVRDGEPVSRGTVQATFKHRSFAEVQRLGVTAEVEATVRSAFPDATGMLVVGDTLPAGPADGVLLLGDVVTHVGEERLNGFLPLEAMLDDHVGQEVQLGVLRGGASLAVSLTVQDLHSVAPDQFLEFGGGILNPLSYQQARTHAVPVSGVVIASSGYAMSEAGLTAGDVLLEVAGVPTPDLDSVEAALAAVAHGERVPLRVSNLAEPHRTRLVPLRIDRQWFPMQRCTRHPTDGTWPCVASPEPPKRTIDRSGYATPLQADDKVGRRMAPSMVAVDFDLPLRTEGVYGPNFRGTGVIVDAERGWVVVDRDTVPVATGDVEVTFGATLTVPGHVVWLHPDHNLAVIGYNPADIGDTPVQAAELDPTPVVRGDRLWQVGLDSHNRLVSASSRVRGLEPAMVPLPSPPFFREANLDVINMDDAAWSMGGVLVDRKGHVRAIWASFVDLSGKTPDAWFSGLPAIHAVEALDFLRSGDARWPSLGFEMAHVGLAKARALGLDDGTAASLASMDRNRVVLGVVRTAAGSPAAAVLREGDLLLAVDGVPVTTFAPVERAVRDGKAKLTVLRDGAHRELELTPWMLEGAGTNRVVAMAGAILHEPHLALATQRGLEREGVYVAWYWYGSPAARFGLKPTTRIVAVDDQPTPNLDALLQAVGDRPAGSSLRLNTVDLHGRRSVLTLKLDPVNWPTTELTSGENGWVREAWTSPVQ